MKTLEIQNIFVLIGECPRPSPGCTASFDLYTNVDCDGDGILDHACSTTINENRWLVLSSEGCPSTWGTHLRSISDCPQAFNKGKSHSHLIFRGT